MLQDLLLRAPLILCCYQRKLGLQQNSLFFKSGIRRRPNSQDTNSNNRREERTTLYNISSEVYFILFFLRDSKTKNSNQKTNGGFGSVRIHFRNPNFSGHVRPYWERWIGHFPRALTVTCRSSVNQHPPAHHPVDARYYSVVDERQLS
jgi:hypothetical protein